MLIFSRTSKGEYQREEIPAGYVPDHLPDGAIVVLPEPHRGGWHLRGLLAPSELTGIAIRKVSRFNREPRPGTHPACARGHVRTPDNTYVGPDGRATCLHCKYAWTKPAYDPAT